MAIDISDDERKRRSDAAKRLVAEGKIGGAEYGKLGGRPRKPRASELIAEQARKEAKKLSRALFDGVDKRHPQHIRQAAVKAILEIEEKEERLTRDDADRLAEMNRDQILGVIAARLSKLDRAGVLADIELEPDKVRELPADEEEAA